MGPLCLSDTLQQLSYYAQAAQLNCQQKSRPFDEAQDRPVQVRPLALSGLPVDNLTHDRPYT
jgi:hypothetical protein